MIIGYGGYGKVWHPPRDDTIFPKNVRKNQKYIQRYTDQTLDQIKKGEKARRIFDPTDSMTNPVLYLFPRQNGFFSQIMPFRQKKFSDDLLEKNRGKSRLFWKTMKKIEPLIEGLVRLHKKKMIHRDIKKNNMVYDDKPDLKIYLIDWGTAIPFSEVFNKENNHWLTTTKENLPPEYKMYANEKKIYSYLNNDIYKDFSENELMPLFEYFDPNYRVHLKEADDEFKRYFSKKSKTKTVGDPLLEKIAQKVDIYAMGVVFAQIYAYLVENKSIPQKEGVIHMIRNMIHPNPFQRWDAKTVLAYLQELLQAVTNKP